MGKAKPFKFLTTGFKFQLLHLVNDSAPTYLNLTFHHFHIYVKNEGNTSTEGYETKDHIKHHL